MPELKGGPVGIRGKGAEGADRAAWKSYRKVSAEYRRDLTLRSYKAYRVCSRLSNIRRIRWKTENTG